MIKMVKLVNGIEFDTINGIETELVLSHTDLDVIMSALNVYENYIMNNEPLFGEDENGDKTEDYDIWSEENGNYESFDNRFTQFLNQ